jgi:hypothetical protein
MMTNFPSGLGIKQELCDDALYYYYYYYSSPQVQNHGNNCHCRIVSNGGYQIHHDPELLACILLGVFPCLQQQEQQFIMVL